MAVTVPRLDSPGDAELISAVRGGDVDAYGELFERHVQAARRLARQLTTPGEADDLVSEAFVKVLTVLQRGGGPDLAFRAYLLTAVRRLHVDRVRAGARLQTTDDMESFDPGVPFRDTVVEGFESEAAARAFASLPERWQLVLWHTEVEGHKPADIAPLLGMSPNSVSALAYRAREGLRQAFLTQHAADTEEDTCRWCHQHLGGYVRHGLSRRDTAKVEQHLQECRRCTAIYLELSQVNDNLSGILAPLLLGGVAAAYVGTTTAGATTTAAGGLLAALDRAKDAVLANTGATAAGGVAAVTVVAGATFFAVQPDEAGPVADAPAASSPAEAGGGASPDRQGGTPRRGDGPGRERFASERERGPGDTATVPAPVAAPAEVPPVPDTGVPDPEAPAPDPAPAPPPQPAPEPDPQPAPEPPPEPPPEPDPGPERADLRLTGSVAPGLAGGTMTVTPSGLPAGTTATLSVSSDAPSVALHLLDTRCDLVAVGSAECMVSAGDPSPFSFRVVGRTGTRVTFRLSGAGADADPSDNTVVLAIP